MTVLVGLASALLFSPVPVLLALVLAIVLAARVQHAGPRRTALIWTLAVTTAVLLVFSTGLGSSLVLRPLESRYPAWPGQGTHVDAVAVLGSGINGGAPDATFTVRLAAAFSLAQRLQVPVIVSGGRTWNDSGRGTEADAGVRFLEDLGMPASRVMSEPVSRTTWENAREVSRLAAARGLRRVALVTSSWHMPRAMLSFRRAGVDAVPAPAGSLAGGETPFLRGLVPSFQRLHESALALREYAGIAAYAVRR